jgi:hypothetical protein
VAGGDVRRHDANPVTVGTQGARGALGLLPRSAARAGVDDFYSAGAPDGITIH